MNEFKVGDKVCILKNVRTNHSIQAIGKIIEFDKNDSTFPYCVDVEGQEGWYKEGDLELAPTKNQRITSLEEIVEQQQNEINELKVIVHQLRENGLPSTILSVEGESEIIEFEGAQYRKVDRLAREGDVVILNERGTRFFFTNKPYLVKYGERISEEETITSGELYDNGRTQYNVDVYELIVKDKQSPITLAAHYKTKSANESRAEIIEKAKVFVSTIVGEYDTFRTTIGQYKDQCVQPVFQVNENKRAIAVLIYGAFGKPKQLVFKGIAKCMPSDIFNEHIGKAIALGRALGLDVSEFEQAVQPTEVVAGHIVETLTRKGAHHQTFEVGSVTHNHSIELRHVGETHDDGFTPFEVEYGDRIINDTNAIYEVK